MVKGGVMTNAVAPSVNFPSRPIRLTSLRRIERQPLIVNSVHPFVSPRIDAFPEEQLWYAACELIRMLQTDSFVKRFNDSDSA